MVFTQNLSLSRLCLLITHISFEFSETLSNVFCVQYATWDLAFHMIPMADIDLAFTKQQLLLFLSNRYMHPTGQVRADM